MSDNQVIELQMDLSPDIWIDIFDRLEHPERQALDKIYPLYHQRWAVRRAQYLLARTSYVSHHTVESLTEVLLGGKIEVDCTSKSCERTLKTRVNNFFGDSSYYPLSFRHTATAEAQMLQAIKQVMIDNCQALIPSVSPVFFVAAGDDLVILDEFQRAWVNGRLIVENTIQFKYGDQSLLFLTASGELYKYWRGEKSRCLAMGNGPITHVSGEWLIRENKILPILRSCGRFQPLDVVLGNDISLFLFISAESNQLLFLVQDETGCYLLYCSRTEELKRQRLPRLKQAISVSEFAIHAQQEDDSLLRIRDFHCEKVEMKQLGVKGNLVPVTDLPLIVHKQCRYYWVREWAHGSELITMCCSTQLNDGPCFRLVYYHM